MRTLFYVVLSTFILALSFCNPCGSGVHLNITGVSNFHTYFDNRFVADPQVSSNIDSMALYLNSEYAYSHLPKNNLINSAFACDPVLPNAKMSDFIDSIIVKSSTVYRNPNLLVTDQIHYNISTNLSTATLQDFNNGFNRNVLLGESGQVPFFLKQRPINSDSFQFSFSYWKNGIIIDSSKTQTVWIEQ